MKMLYNKDKEFEEYYHPKDCNKFIKRNMVLVEKYLERPLSTEEKTIFKEKFTLFFLLQNPEFGSVEQFIKQNRNKTIN